MNKNHIQQGDVILKRVARLPRNTKTISKGQATLAWGEHSGHHHTIESGVELLEAPNGVRFVVNEGENAVLTHQEHDPVTIEPGIWQIGRVREKDYFEDMVRQVID